MNNNIIEFDRTYIDPPVYGAPLEVADTSPLIIKSCFIAQGISKPACRTTESVVPIIDRSIYPGKPARGAFVNDAMLVSRAPSVL